MNIYIEMIDGRKDNLGRQVFFLGWDDPNVGGRKVFQVFNSILKDKIDKWENRGYKIVFT